MLDKNKSIIDEVLDEIELSLKNSHGVYSHQRRLAFSLSIGAVTLIEEYLIKKKVFKSGAKINHLWFKKKRENAKKIISKQISCPIENLDKIDILLNLAYGIEKERNELAYGKPVSDSILKNKIELFLNLKKEVENA